MADLTELQASQSVKITGASSTGTENTFVGSTANGELRTADIIDTAGVQGALSISTTAIQVKVGASNLVGRTNVTVLNNGTATIYWGRNSSVTTATGTPIMRNQLFSWDIGPNSDIYLIAVSGSHDTRITEA